MAQVGSPGPIGAVSAADATPESALAAARAGQARVRIRNPPWLRYVTSDTLPNGTRPGNDASGGWTWTPRPPSPQALKKHWRDARRYPVPVTLTGGDRFRRGSRTFRGVPRRSTLVNNAATHSCQRRQLRSGCLNAADL